MSNVFWTMVAVTIVAIPLTFIFPPLGIGGWLAVFCITLIDGAR